MVSPSAAAAAAALVACANIISMHQITLVNGFTTTIPPKTFLHSNGFFTHHTPTTDSKTSLWVAAATTTTSKEPATKAPPKKKKSTTGGTKQGASTPKDYKDTNKPGSRQDKKKQFMMKKWRSEQKSDQKRKARQQQKREGTVDTQLVNAVGMSVSSLLQEQVNKKRPSNSQPKKNASSDAKKIWNANADRMSQQKIKRKPNNNIQGQKTASAKSQENLLPWTNLLPGSTISGKVIKALPFGVLVQTNYDIPGRTPGCALLHNNQFLDDDSEVDNKSTTTKVGVTTKKKKPLLVGSVIENARVINVNRDKGTVNISLRPATNRSTKLSTLQVGDEVEGKVVRLKQYGAFIDVGHKRNALLHLSRMSMYKVQNITDHVRVGQTVKVRILRVTGERDIAVSMLSTDNDAFVDRRELQAKRMALWQKVVTASATDGDDLQRAKRELLQVDRAIWDQFMSEESQNGAPPRRSMEL